MSYGPFFLRHKEQELGEKISLRRPRGADMFKSGVFVLKPTDILFFNKEDFKINFQN